MVNFVIGILMGILIGMFITIIVLSIDRACEEDDMIEYYAKLEDEIERLNNCIDRTIKIIQEDWNEKCTIPIWSIATSNDIRVKLYNELFFKGKDKIKGEDDV